jgi:acyl-coenzyme A synthetase/AMP-(fatty) acid ligase/thioesterase domain-containing protein/acyl carrier protein
MDPNPKSRPPGLSFDEAEVQDTIPERFEQVVSRCPDHIAIRSPHQTLTYRSLHLAAECLAFALRARLGDSPESVALMLENDAPIVVAIIGVIQAGKYYCALNPEEPASRTAAMLKDLGARLLVTDRPHLALARQIAPSRCEVIALDDLITGGSGRLPPQLKLSADALMGMYYTSGSTGKPKSVPRNHGVILHRVWLDVKDLDIRPDDRLLMLRPFQFAGSSSDLFDTLLTGASLYPYDVLKTGISPLPRILIQEKITILRPPIELLRYFLDSLDTGDVFPEVRCLVLSGDVLFRRDIEQIRRHFSRAVEIYHHLATSETGVLARLVIKSDTALTSNIVPVGYPVPGKELLIVDEEGKKLEQRQSGEIAVRTRWMAMHQESGSDSREGSFIQDPDDASLKVYLTGDLGRFREDGALEFIGRKDFQVKIRGFRVNTLAIANKLLELDSIKRAVVTTRSDASGEKRLVAYLIREAGDGTSAEDLRAWLSRSLPDYMIPSVFIFLDVIPITLSGKIDYRSLPEPDWSHPDLQPELLSPRDDLERSLVGLWQEILGVKTLGVQDDFFALGGHSLSGAILCSRIEEEYGKKIYPADLMVNNTVERIARHLRQESPELRAIVPFQASGTQPPLFLAPGNGGDTLYFRVLSTYLGADQPVYGLQLTEVGRMVPASDLDAMAAYYIQEIHSIQPHGPYYLAGHSFGGRLAFAIAHQLVQAGERVNLLVLLDTYSPSQHPRASLPERAKLHVDNLRALPLQRWPDYLRGRWTNIIIRASQFHRVRPIIERLHLIPSDPVARNRFASRGYVYRHYPGKLVLFRARERAVFVRKDLTSGWSEYADELEVHEVPGNHANLINEPNVQTLAETLKKCIQEAQSIRPAEAASSPSGKTSGWMADRYSR